ncbi:hypothetical protein [Mitsuokella jalaludinii]|uniref:hypothetical protein n=1 Tax=Mitsuokella jalaludinii TaxID=187979 RepID=UPI00307D2D2F
MILTKHAQELYQAIERLGGGAIREQRLRAESGGFSHGTFIAARQELCQAGLIAIERIARKPHYRLADPARAARILAESAALYAPDADEARPAGPPPRSKRIPLHLPSSHNVSEDSHDTKDNPLPEQQLVPIAVFCKSLPHIAGHFTDLADWLAALAEEFGDFDLDEGCVPRAYILYVPALRCEDHYEVWPMPDGLMVL